MPSAKSEMHERCTPSVEGMADTIREVNTNGLLVIGSVGRAAVFNELTGNPYLEFEERGEGPLATNEHIYGFRKPRDVDTIGGPVQDEGHRRYWPHAPDPRAFNNGRLMIIRSGDDWAARTLSRDGRVSHTDLDSELFEPFEGQTIYDISCKTVRPATQTLLLTNASKIQRPKDIIARRLLSDVMPDSERAFLSSNVSQVLRNLLINS